MRTYWNEKTGETIQSPVGGLAQKLQREGWKSSPRYGWAKCYKWGIGAAKFFLYKVEGKYRGVVVTGHWAQARWYYLASELTKLGCDLTGEEYLGLYQNRTQEKSNLRLNQVVAKILTRNNITEVSERQLRDWLAD